MTIRKTAYDTSATAGFQIQQEVDAITAARITGDIQFDSDTGLLLVQRHSDKIRPFAHPLLVPGKDSDAQLALDVRPFGIWNGDQYRFDVRKSDEYRIAILRGRLNRIWIEQPPQFLRDVSPVPMMVYASLLSETIKRNFNLDPAAQYQLSILAAILYASNFTNEQTWSPMDKMRLTSTISRNLRVKAEDVQDLLDQASVIPSLQAFCALAASVTQNVRLKELNSGVVITLIAGQWFGFNAKEMMLVAMEHPPTWVALLMAAFEERSFKNSQLTKLMDNVTGRSQPDEFHKATLNLLQAHRN